jgi:hypothetical protein
LKALEEVTVIVDLTTATPEGTAEFRFDQVGHSTYLGAFYNVEGTGVWDLVNNIPLSMETTLVGANGDTLHGASDVPGFLYFDGGTGRFADAVGWSQYTPISVSAPIFNPGTITISFVNDCEGELTF